MDNIIFLGLGHLGYVWLIIALIFLFIELSTPGFFFFIAFAIGSCFASIMAFLNYSLVSQCLVSLASMLIAFFILRHYFAIKSKDKIETNINALIGKKGLVIKRVEINKPGLIKVGGEIWTAEVKNDLVLEKNTEVTVIAVKGSRLLVKN